MHKHKNWKRWNKYAGGKFAGGRFASGRHGDSWDEGLDSVSGYRREKGSMEARGMGRSGRRMFGRRRHSGRMMGKGLGKGFGRMAAQEGGVRRRVVREETTVFTDGTRVERRTVIKEVVGRGERPEMGHRHRRRRMDGQAAEARSGYGRGGRRRFGRRHAEARHGRGHGHGYGHGEAMSAERGRRPMGRGRRRGHWGAGERAEMFGSPRHHRHHRSRWENRVF